MSRVSTVHSKKPPIHKHSVTKTHKKLFVALAVFGVVLVLSVVAGLLILKNSELNKVSKAAESKIRSTLLDGAEQPKTRQIESGYGFKLDYDETTFTATAHVLMSDSDSQQYKATTYTDNEIDQKRNYTLVKIGFREQPVKSENSKLPTLTLPDLTIGTNRKRNYFDRTSLPDEYKDTSKFSDLDLMQKVEVDRETKDSNYFSHKVSDVKINGKSFRRIEVTKGYTFEGKKYENSRTYKYITTQNGRPYWITINVFGNPNDPQRNSYIQQLESIIAGIEFTEVDQDALIRHSIKKQPTVTLASSTKGVSDDDIVNQPKGYIDSESLIKVVARNQIATVRVGAMRCADTEYTAQNGAKLHLSNVCSVGIGSGSIVSGDGYVITNGHVTDLPDGDLITGMRTDAHFAAFYRFVVSAGYISRDSLVSLVNKAANGDEQSISVLYGLIDNVPKDSQIVTNEKTNYIIQTSDNPIKLDESSDDLKWNFNKTNLKAERIDSEVSKGEDRFNFNSPYTDVAILKMEGSFPTITIGDSTKVRSGDSMTALGYPAFVDEGLRTEKEKTIPTATTGYVHDVFRDGGNHILFGTSTPIASGNSGGPAFNKQGEQIGINTYGTKECDDGKCFGNGWARDVNDAVKMLKKNNISTKSDGELTKLWEQGIKDFSNGRYSKAKESFEKLNEKYPNNYLVQRFVQVSGESVDTASDPEMVVDSDLSLAFESNSALIGVVAIASLSGLGFVITMIVVIVAVISSRGKRPQYQYAYQTAQSGTAPNYGYQAQTQAQQQYYYNQTPPHQAQYPQTQYPHTLEQPQSYIHQPTATGQHAQQPVYSNQQQSTQMTQPQLYQPQTNSQQQPQQAPQQATWTPQNNPQQPPQTENGQPLPPSNQQQPPFGR